MSQEQPNSGFDQKERRRRLFVVALWVGMLLYVFLVPGSAAEGVYQCPFHAITGFDCPGCGMTRASVHAVRFEFAESFRYHPFGVLFVAGLTSLALFRLAELIKGRAIHLRPLVGLKPYANKMWLAVLILAALFGLGRLALEMAGILTPL